MSFTTIYCHNIIKETFCFCLIAFLNPIPDSFNGHLDMHTIVFEGSNVCRQNTCNVAVYEGSAKGEQLIKFASNP